MNHQGLDALAALAAAASQSPYPSASNGASTGSGSGGEPVDTPSDKAAPEVTSPPSTVPDMAAAQQWQQAIANAASSMASGVVTGGPNNHLASLLGLSQQLNPVATNPNLIAIQQQMAMQQQMNYFQLLAHAAAANQQRQFVGAVVHPTTQPALSQAMGAPTTAIPFPNMNGISPVASSTVAGFSSPTLPSTMTNGVHLLNGPTVATSSPVPIGYPTPHATIHAPTPLMATLAPQPVKTRSSLGTTTTNTTAAAAADGAWSDNEDHDDSEYYNNGDKRQLKRVANRKSAQLSRKRKKQFMEELKEENDSLRRKEQILRSIPDLVVVFDSSGKLWFVSESVSRFLDFTVDELEGTSFWNRLCDDSVRLLKAAFMDSLAARQGDAETASLGSGTWELRLVDKDGTRKVVTLHGVVHFAGDRPECVCSIRPSVDTTGSQRTENGSRPEAFVSVSTSSTGSGSLKRHRSSKLSSSLVSHVNPNQSVVVSSSSETTTNEPPVHSDAPSSLRGSANGAVRISDSGNSSGSSDSGGSGDELNSSEIAA